MYKFKVVVFSSFISTERWGGRGIVTHFIIMLCTKFILCKQKICVNLHVSTGNLKTVYFALGHIKLVDFGLSKLVKLGERTGTICGTLQYMGKVEIY